MNKTNNCFYFSMARWHKQRCWDGGRQLLASERKKLGGARPGLERSRSIAQQRRRTTTEKNQTIARARAHETGRVDEKANIQLQYGLPTTPTNSRHPCCATVNCALRRNSSLTLPRQTTRQQNGNPAIIMYFLVHIILLLVSFHTS